MELSGADATTVFAGPSLSQPGHPTPCKSTKSRLQDADITRRLPSPAIIIQTRKVTSFQDGSTGSH